MPPAASLNFQDKVMCFLNHIFEIHMALQKLKCSPISTQLNNKSINRQAYCSASSMRLLLNMAARTRLKGP